MRVRHHLFQVPTIDLWAMNKQLYEVPSRVTINTDILRYEAASQDQRRKRTPICSDQSCDDQPRSERSSRNIEGSGLVVRPPCGQRPGLEVTYSNKCQLLPPIDVEEGAVYRLEDGQGEQKGTASPVSMVS